jgi:hypothetical protein
VPCSEWIGRWLPESPATKESRDRRSDLTIVFCRAYRIDESPAQNWEAKNHLDGLKRGCLINVALRSTGPHLVLIDKLVVGFDGGTIVPQAVVQLGFQLQGRFLPLTL